MNIKGKHPRGRSRSRREQQVRKDIMQKEGGPWGEPERRMSFGKIETDDEAIPPLSMEWCSSD
jgi:hypothetical protein